MANAKVSLPPLVQAYDYSKVREYYKYYQGLIFGHEKLVRAESLEEYLMLNIETEKVPDKIIFNGKEVKLVEVTL